MESYSSLKRRTGGYHLTTTLVDEQELRGQDELGSNEEAVGEDELPGGVRTGLFLHDTLERLDYHTLTQYRDVDEWIDDPEVHALFERSMLEHGVEPQYLALSQRVIWRALNGVVQVEGEGVIYGLGHCIPNIRELEFMYPIPEASHPSFGDEVDDELTIERGFIKGYVDYTFEWNDMNLLRRLEVGCPRPLRHQCALEPLRGQLHQSGDPLLHRAVQGLRDHRASGV